VQLGRYCSQLAERREDFCFIGGGQSGQGAFDFPVTLEAGSFIGGFVTAILDGINRSAGGARSSLGQVYYRYELSQTRNRATNVLRRLRARLDSLVSAARARTLTRP
jgi:hypothetical protein